MILTFYFSDREFAAGSDGLEEARKCFSDTHNWLDWCLSPTLDGKEPFTENHTKIFTPTFVAISSALSLAGRENFLSVMHQFVSSVEFYFLEIEDLSINKVMTIDEYLTTRNKDVAIEIYVALGEFTYDLKLSSSSYNQVSFSFFLCFLQLIGFQVLKNVHFVSAFEQIGNMTVVINDILSFPKEADLQDLTTLLPLQCHWKECNMQTAISHSIELLEHSVLKFLQAESALLNSLQVKDKNDAIQLLRAPFDWYLGSLRWCYLCSRYMKGKNVVQHSHENGNVRTFEV